jgi:FkbM family methyltransferase
MQSTKLAPFTVFFDNSEEYHHLKNEIFTQGAYYFETDNARPRIIDAGAHIGLSTLYFKKLFPGAQVTAIEPNPAVIPFLEKNIWENNLTDVEVVTAALADEAGQMEFFSDASDEQWLSTASFHNGAWTETQTSQKILVPTLPLTDFLDQPVDFLKMDIEGAEQRVLVSAGNQLTQVQHMMVEFHPLPEQSLSKLCKHLTDLHFKVRLWKDQNEVTEKQAHGLVYIEAWQKKQNK